MKKFLSARWEDLIMANYAVEPSLLENRVPKGTELDLFEGNCFISLVAFKFVETKVLGIPIPLHTDFEEVNLRFYVKRAAGNEVRRGVVFVKEFVPKAMVAWVARTLFGEPYETWKMSHDQTEEELTYIWSDSTTTNRMYVENGDNLGFPVPYSLEEFIIEHYWGYTSRGPTRTDEYKVEHPKWELCELNYAELEVDFGETYGPDFAFLTDTTPDSILFAKGSEIAVYKGAKLHTAGK